MRDPEPAAAWRSASSEALRVEVLDAAFASGLKVRFAPTPGMRQKTAVLAVRFGSLDGAFVPIGGSKPVRAPPGLAHFLEHRLFQSEEGDALERFAALGATSNAFTTHTATFAYFSGTGAFFECLDILLSFFKRFSVDDEAVARERGIISEELRGAEDSPGWCGWQRLMSCLYVESEARFDIGGTQESIAAVTADLLRATHRTFYRPDNSELVIAGDLDPDEVARRTAAAVRGLQSGPPPVRLPATEPGRVAWRRGELRMEVPRPKVFIGFKDRNPATGGRELAIKNLEAEIGLAALFDKGSDFHRDFYEDGTIDDTFSAQAMGEPTLGHAVITGDTDDPARLARVVLERLEQARRSGVAASDVERISRTAAGGLLRVLDHPESSALALSGAGMRDFDLLDLPGLIEGVSAEGVSRRVVELLDPAAHSVFVVMPMA